MSRKKTAKSNLRKSLCIATNAYMLMQY